MQFPNDVFSVIPIMAAFAFLGIIMAEVIPLFRSKGKSD